MTVEGAIADIERIVAERTGLAFAPHRRDELKAGILRAVSRLRLSGPDEYLARLERGDLSLDHLAEELTVGETHIFRHRQHFDWLRDRILPEALPGRGGPLRIWSAGCASGEEAYSIAMATDEDGQRDAVTIVATDLSPRALARARQASYRPWSLRGVDAAARQRWFVHQGGLWRVHDRIRQRVTFELHNLADEARPRALTGPADVVFCRNVLIYLDPETVRRVQRSLLDLLADGGWLILGPSDPPLASDLPVEIVSSPGGVLYRKRASAQATSFAPPVIPPVLDEAPRAVPPPAGAASRADPVGDASSAVERTRAAMAGGSAEAALLVAARSADEFPLTVELHFLHALLLVDLGRNRDAIAALRRVLYLDRTLAVAQFLLGTALRRTGDRAGAVRAYRNALDRAMAVPVDQPLPLGEGRRAGDLADAARAHIAALGEARATP